MTMVHRAGELKRPSTLAPDLISIPKAAERLGLHADTLYRLARTGQFPPAVHVGAKWLVSLPRLERFLHGESASEVAAPVLPTGSEGTVNVR
jgi:excisionase family DNA binding protein